MRLLPVILLATIMLLGSVKLSYSQEKLRLLPSVEMKSLDGKSINSKSFENNGNPIIISFWATWCKPCIQELTNIAEIYDEWKEKTGVKLIAVSIDDARNMSKVGPLANGKGWEYEVYLDPNSDFKRAMNVNTVPHTFLLNGKKEIVWNHNSYAPGDEHKLYEKIVKLSEEKTTP
jgi:cytochrome c biogenesis protein CcmG, thiol:disulfide interchange protein DsbE